MTPAQAVRARGYLARMHAPPRLREFLRLLVDRARSNSSARQKRIMRRIEDRIGWFRSHPRRHRQARDVAASLDIPWRTAP